MGRDKAMVPVAGVAMAARVAAALRAGGCDPVVALGGDAGSLERLGLHVVADAWPGEGPLGAIVAALRWSGRRTFVAACDLAWLDAPTVRAVLAAPAGHDVVVATTGRDEPLCAVWSPTAQAELERRFDAGERAVHAVIDGLDAHRVPVAPGALRNVNRPQDLHTTGPEDRPHQEPSR